MTPNELRVLRLAQELERVNKVTVSRKMDISTDYADGLLRSLSSYGYLEPNASGANSAYTFTQEGRVRLLIDRLQLQAELQKKIDWLTRQRDRLSEKIEALALGEVEKREAPQFEAAALAPIGKTTQR